MKQQTGRKVAILNALGSAGYVACLFQWLWTSLILLPSMLQSPLFQSWFQPVAPVVVETHVRQSTGGGEMPGYLSLIILILGIALVLGMLYVFFAKIPRSVVRTSEKVTHTVADVVTPVVIKHAHLPEKQRREIPRTIILSFKLLLVFAPLCLLLFARGLPLAMSFELIMMIGIVLFSWAFFFFAVQYVASKLLGVDYRKVR